MSSTTKCPVCKNAYGANATFVEAHDLWKVSCGNCGQYIITHEARVDHLENDQKWTPVQRSALSYFVRNRSNLPAHNGTGLPFVTATALRRLESTGVTLPLPTAQAANLIREIGKEQRESGSAFQPGSVSLYSKVGSPSPAAAIDLLYELQNEQLISVLPTQRKHGIDFFAEASLTLRGWQQWEAMSSGRIAGRDGFIAMQFGDERLDQFVSTHIQGTVASILGVNINRVDSPDVSRAGVIDNIMREAIANSAFILVELSHGNKGAYWEAGYAEGLGKPVIYLCEKAVWDNLAQRPHFDVNHCMTVMWSEEQAESFHQQLVATVRNSIR